MAEDASSGASSSSVKTADDPESTIEINIKTLDSQVHKLRVKKNVPVLALKEKIVDATGIPVDQQRLIFRGRVLKDDHLLTEYHLEDGYTLHLVARRTAEGQHPSGTSEENTHANANAAGNGGLLGDISRSVRDILGSLGLAGMPGGVTNTAFSVPLTTQSIAPPGFSILNHQIHVSQLQPSGAVSHNMVIPDSLMTLLEYMNHMDQVLQNNGITSVDSNTQQPPRLDDAHLNQRFPSPDVLVSVIERAQQLFGGSASSALSHLAQRIQRDSVTGDASIRSQIQNESAQLGVAMQHLGAMLLELGRTMMMLRMGPSPADAFVNSGPAVYINSVGPNPIMVQPSFQNTPPFGVSSIPVLGGVSGAFGIVDPSQTSGVAVHGSGVSATSGSSVGTAAVSGGSVNGERQNVERTQGGNPSANSTRGLPTRTVVAAIPARSSVDAPNHVVSVILPVQVRSQVAVPNQSTTSQGSQTAVGNGAQPNSTFVIPQASLGAAASTPSIVAQINAHIANALNANPPPPGQVSSYVQNTANQGSQSTTNNGAGTFSAAASTPTAAQINALIANALNANPPPPGQVSLYVQNTANQGSQSTTNNGAGTFSSATSANTRLQDELMSSNQGQTALNVQFDATRAGTSPLNSSCPNLTSQDSSTMNVSSVDSVRQHEQMEKTHADNVRTRSGELGAANLAGQHTGTSTNDVPLSASAENFAQPNKHSDLVAAQPSKPSASGRSEPLGLGGGLQPKKRSRAARPPGSSDDSGEPLNSSSVSNSQEAVSMGQKVLQAFASQNTDVDRSSVSDSSPPSSTPQFTGGMPPRRQSGEGQVDISSMLSSVLNNPVFGNLLSNVAAQTGVGSGDDLRNMMEECTHSPSVMDTISGMVQNVDGPGRGQGGIDLSRMMQQMMPVVSQVLGGAGARPVGANSGESRLQPQHIDRRMDNTLGVRNSQIDLHQACQHIEQHDSPEDIFSAVLETAAQAYGEDESIQGMLDELVSDPELTNDYLKLLLQQVRQRIQSESPSPNQP